MHPKVDHVDCVSTKPRLPLNNAIPQPPFQHLQLHLIVQQPHFLSRLERWQPNIRTSIAPEGIAERAIPATAHLPLHREIHLGQIVGTQFQRVEGVVGRAALRRVFGFDLLFQAARAVFAGAAALAGFGAAFGRWEGGEMLDGCGVRWRTCGLTLDDGSSEIFFVEKGVFVYELFVVGIGWVMGVVAEVDEANFCWLRCLVSIAFPFPVRR